MPRFTGFNFGITELTSMFHQDWTNEGDALDVLRMHLWNGQDAREVHALHRDALQLLEGLSAGQIQTLWLASTHGRAAFGTESTSAQKWMRVILTECEKWHRDRSDPPLGEVDTDSGFALGAEIKEIIVEFSHSGLTSHTAEALCNCVQNCSPDLALRFLFRIISSEGLSISNAQYATLLRLGVDLGYGEFLVTEVDYLVDPDSD